MCASNHYHKYSIEIKIQLKLLMITINNDLSTQNVRPIIKIEDYYMLLDIHRIFRAIIYGLRLGVNNDSINALEFDDASDAD
jgi:6-pyruvoyl-tetrahydropterin synthase